MGSVRQLVNAQGQVKLAQSYDPFRNLIEQIGQIPSGFGYTGQQHDPSAGLVYLRARYYDPTTGRFISKDPFPGLPTLPQTHNPYPYVINNPINYTDPTGEYFESPIDVAFIVYDVVSYAYNSYNYRQATNRCDRDYYARQMGIDTVALAIDVGFLFLPGTEGGLGYRLAYAGGGHLAFAGATRAAVQTGRVIQAGTKGAQIGHQTALFAMETSHTPSSGSSWKFGGFKSTTKWHNQMTKRGWTPKLITEAVATGKQYPATNNVNPSNTAIRYIHPKTGRSVVVDTVTYI